MRLASRLSAAAVPGAVAAILLLLGLLATLQYRWAGELSEAERARLSAAAKARAEGLSREFDLEVTRAWAGLQMGAAALRTRDFGAYADRYQAWHQAAAHPALVREVLLLEPEGSELRLSRFSPGGRTFEAAVWPAGLDAVRRRAEELMRPGGGRSGFRGRPDAMNQGLPALFLPVFDRPGERPESGERRSPGPGERPRPEPGERRGPPGPWGMRPDFFGPPALVIAVLDAGQVLPGLAARHFGGPDGGDHDLTVVSQSDRRRVWWQSRPGAGVPERPEAVAGLLDIRVEELGRGDRPGPPGPPRAHTEDTGGWRLLVSRREGPLDQVVAAARRRNLAVGFGILLLLASSVALVVASSQRARRLGQRQVEFVAAVSHELRTPVAVICSTAENLADGVVTEPAQVRRYGAILRDEGLRLGEMVEQVLQFAGALSGRRTLQREPVDVARLFVEALEPFAAALEERGFTVLQDVAAGLPTVQGDAAVLRRALQNLVENALKYDGEGRWLALGAEAAGGHEVRITVEDHGQGIAPAELPHVFEPFFRGREARDEQVHGFGLGLALVRRVIEEHGGRVDLASTVGRGTLFTIRLPATPPAAPAAAETTDVLPHPHR
jgi:signal transduction histidine kinase